MSSYFICQMDIDFKTRIYGEDTPRLYLNENNYINIIGVSYDNCILIVKDDFDNHLKLEKEPNNDVFEKTLYKEWKNFDDKYGINDKNRSDYEPMAYNSLESVAIELKLLNKKDVKLYHNKSYLSG